MSALAIAELRRLAARRFVRVLALLAAAVAALAGVLVFLNHDDLDEATLAGRRLEAERRVAACLRGELAVPDLSGPPGREAPIPVDPGADREAFCREVAGRVDDPRFQLSDLPGVVKGTTAPLVIVATVIGAAAIGGDWQSRSLTTLLTWEPRRTRVLLAKVGAVAVVAVAFTVAAQALVAGALLPTAWWRGSTAGTGVEWARAVGGALGRGSVLAAVFAVLGFAGASVAKNTTAVLGGAFGYVVVVENVVGGLLEDWRPWLLLGNAIVWVSGEGDEVVGRTVTEAGLYLVALAAGATALAALAFRSRDVP